MEANCAIFNLFNLFNYNFQVRQKICMKDKNVLKNLISPQEETKAKNNILEESSRDQTEQPVVLKSDWPKKKAFSSKIRQSQ